MTTKEGNKSGLLKRAASISYDEAKPDKPVKTVTYDEESIVLIIPRGVSSALLKMLSDCLKNKNKSKKRASTPILSPNVDGVSSDEEDSAEGQESSSEEVQETAMSGLSAFLPMFMSLAGGFASSYKME